MTTLRAILPGGLTTLTGAGQTLDAAPGRPSLPFLQFVAFDAVRNRRGDVMRSAIPPSHIPTILIQGVAPAQGADANRGAP